jgi:hypothetical protein
VVDGIMTRRFYATSNPQDQRGPLQPMDRTDAEFWRLLHERRNPQRELGFWRHLFRRQA